MTDCPICSIESSEEKLINSVLHLIGELTILDERTKNENEALEHLISGVKSYKKYMELKK